MLNVRLSSITVEPRWTNYANIYTACRKENLVPPKEVQEYFGEKGPDSNSQELMDVVRGCIFKNDDGTITFDLTTIPNWVTSVTLSELISN